MKYLDEFKALYSLLIFIGSILYFCGTVGKYEDSDLNKITKLIGLYLGIMPIFYIGLLNFVSVAVAIIFMILVTLLLVGAFF